MPNLLQRLRDSFRLQAVQQPTIYCYGDRHLELAEAEMQSVMEWLFFSLMAVNYSGEAHLCWYDNDNSYPGIEAGALEGLKRGEPVFGYRLGGRMFPAPEGWYWRLMPEQTTMRVYQLELGD